MPVMRIDGRACTMQVFPLRLSYIASLCIGPDGQHLDIELNFACGSGHTLECVMALGYKRCDVCEKLIPG